MSWRFAKEVKNGTLYVLVYVGVLKAKSSSKMSDNFELWVRINLKMPLHYEGGKLWIYSLE